MVSRAGRVSPFNLTAFINALLHSDTMASNTKYSQQLEGTIWANYRTGIGTNRLIFR